MNSHWRRQAQSVELDGAAPGTGAGVGAGAGTGTGALAVEDIAPQRRQEAQRHSQVGRRIEAWALVVMWVLLIISFSLAEPGLFMTIGNWANILGSQAVLLMLALASLIPLVMRDFDLSLGGIATLSAMTMAILNVEDHMNVVLDVEDRHRHGRQGGDAAQRQDRKSVV